MNIKFLFTVFLVLVIWAGTSAQDNGLALIPKPQSIIKQEGAFSINFETKIVYKGKQKELLPLAIMLSDISGEGKLALQIEKLKRQDDNVILLTLDKTLEKLGDEGYTLNVNPKTIKLSASNTKGIFYGIQTLKQLAANDENKIPAYKIEDSPRFGWRGFMLDCSRHFWTIAELETVIDQMARMKMNRLHLHLTDDQGWRLEIKKYPKLTTVGTHYKDLPEMSGNFYTQDQMRALIKYAADKNIMIVPEIDLPGHSRAVLAAYPELSCRGGEFEVYPMEQPSGTVKRWYEVMLCAGNPKTYQFTEDVVAEVAALFPSPYIHLGGDEVGKDIWKECAHCQAKIKEEGLKDEEELQDHYTRFASEVIASHNKRMIGWDEINDRGAASSNDVVMVWRDTGVPQAQKALESGLNVIMCPQHGCYFDWGYSGNSTKKVYNWNPIPPDASAQEAQLIKGAQACLWTERVATPATIEERIFPRILALAEVVWLNPENHNWDDFLSRLQNHYPLLDKWGINYYHEDEIDAEEFNPGKEKPALVRHAFIETTLGIYEPYYAEYVFDGRTNTYFWTNRPPIKDEYLLITLGELVKVNEIEVITGDSKDFLEHGILEISEDGKNFKKVADFKDGMATAQLDGLVIKAVRLKITDDHKGWMIIKEVKIK
ncbi:hexosaminidase [Saccharicrinis carchari]|uniref:beta-N-acetylhexosaminidase n=1 Tax=Saccharicrinis carchari TaxID=1168039 RepID=A0A521EBR4_SACCC|nr:family 20 glycosylhydrolase [Saccharicrinis carchari]SMO81347.1 hexosaminidase [Saccharicrinis carchari]